MRVPRHPGVGLGTTFYASPTNALSLKQQKIAYFFPSSSNKWESKMKTETANSLSMLFEVDRGTMLRALKNTLPDEERTPGRPKYKVATAAKALENHHLTTGRANSRRARNNGGSIDVGWQDPILARIYSELDAAEAAMRALPSLDQRRKAAVCKMAPLISRMERAILERGEANGQDSELTGLRADKLYTLALRGLEGPCQWTMSETWDAMNIETD
jgi:hypothetical protein